MQKIIEDIMESLIKNAERLSEQELIEKKSESSVSSTEFFNRILPDDILQIVRKLKTDPISSQTEEDKFSKSPSLSNNEETKNVNSYTPENFSASKLSNILEDVKSINEKFVSSSSSFLSGSEFPSGLMNKSGIPKELLPVLEKQGSRKNLFFSSPTNTFLNKKLTDKNITEIMKPISIDNTPFASGECMQTEFYNNLEKPVDTEVKKINTEKLNRKSASLLTLKSMFKNFTSSASSITMSLSSIGPKSKSSASGKVKWFFLPKDIKTSSDSISVGEILKEKKDENNDIITIAKPQQIYSSGSITSENVGVDESVYYLAETDSDKIVAIN